MTALDQELRAGHGRQGAPRSRIQVESPSSNHRCRTPEDRGVWATVADLCIRARTLHTSSQEHTASHHWHDARHARHSAPYTADPSTRFHTGARVRVHARITDRMRATHVDPREHTHPPARTQAPAPPPAHAPTTNHHRHHTTLRACHVRAVSALFRH
jgi:hypothetical protein